MSTPDQQDAFAEEPRNRVPLGRHVSPAPETPAASAPAPENAVDPGDTGEFLAAFRENAEGQRREALGLHSASAQEAAARPFPAVPSPEAAGAQASAQAPSASSGLYAAPDTAPAAAHAASPAPAPLTPEAPAPIAGDDSVPDSSAAAPKQHGVPQQPRTAASDNENTSPQPTAAEALPREQPPAAEAPHRANDPGEGVPAQDTAAVPDDKAASPSQGEDVTSPEDTAEIDVEAIEAKIDNDPGSTLSFEPLPEERIDTSSTYDAGTSTELTWGARSDVGCVRSHNEDSYLVQSPLFCVSDGMGGHAAGEVASSITVETIAKTAPATADAALLGAAVESANAAVIEAAEHGRGKPGMGCTATAAYIEGHTLAIAHVGDSRAYLLHDGMLIRVTHDHSLVEELVDAGEITADEARTHPNRSVITRALGSDPHMYADHFQLNIEKGDRLILCSDGLSGMIPDRQIERIATESSSPQLCADNLVDAALAAGGTDNVTVVVVDVMDDGRMRELRRRRRRNALIALGALLALLVACTVALGVYVTGSLYLGVKDGAVAVYRGIPSSPLGLELHWLEDETSVQVDQLPEDTQARLEEGIPQPNMDEAQHTIANYREQIDSQQSREALTAQTLQEQQNSGSDDATADSAAADPAANAQQPEANQPAAENQGGAE